MKKITFIISFLILSISFSQTTHYVIVGEMSYSPNNINIELGDQVQFTHEGSGIHDVNFTTNSITGQPFNNPAEISTLPANGEYQSEPGLMGVITFDVPGVYNYDCSMYGHAAMGMVGSITVNEVNNSSISTHYNCNKFLIKTIDFFGRETTNKGFQLKVYDNGSVEKKYMLK